MTDIVETLRQGSLSKDDYRWEAADEIERLRAALKLIADGKETEPRILASAMLEGK
jgi:hypothetical protein